jgi:hypothetical protein
MNTELLDKIALLAGGQRAHTFRAAAQFILQHDCKTIVETGCYRGVPADGQSTLIMALLAKELNGMLNCFDISYDSITRAAKLLENNGINNYHGTTDHVHPDGTYGIFGLVNYAAVSFHKIDSIIGLAYPVVRSVRFAYLDSLDHQPNNPGPCQRHQLAEVGAILGKMRPPCGILLDDHVPGTGGKTLLSAAFLQERGWTLSAEGYQLFFTKL